MLGQILGVIKLAHRYKSSLTLEDITPEIKYLNRRQLILGSAAALTGGIGGFVNASSQYSTDETLNTYEQITNYNNYYEFGTRKGDPAKYAHALKTTPWSIKIDGLVDRPMTLSMSDILKKMVIEQRIYRFKSIKAVVRITLTDKEPPTSWNMANPTEYGFYSNVNPNVDHPRWTQGSERRISTSFVAKRQPTLLFNGYEKEVSNMYAGMNLRDYF